MPPSPECFAKVIVVNNSSRCVPDFQIRTYENMEERNRRILQSMGEEFPERHLGWELLGKGGPLAPGESIEMVYNKYHFEQRFIISEEFMEGGKQKHTGCYIKDVNGAEERVVFIDCKEDEDDK